jgi:hypothetical protein
MSRLLTIALLVAIIPVLVFAQIQSNFPPPPHGSYGGGWGMNPTNWFEATGSFYAWGLYDPLHDPLGGDAWVVDWSTTPVTYIDYEDISLELWVELYGIMTYHYTSYQWHRLGDTDECIEFIIEGLTKSNHAIQVAIMEADLPPTHLYFVEDIFGRTGPEYGSDLPITWYGRWGTGSVYGENIVYPFGGGWHQFCAQPICYLMLITEPCDHWFQFKGEFCIPYHQPDGYYRLEMAGCPAPIL